MRTMLVASRGGHLRELCALAPRLGLDERTVWVTNDSPQSRVLLRGRDVRTVPYSASRRADVVARNAWRARVMLRLERVDRVVSTGAGIALSYLPVAAQMGIEAHYVESATRVRAPSLTGRVLQRVPQVHRWSQYPGWDGWPHLGCVFDGFEAGADAPAGAREIRRVVVTLGTWRQDFRSLVARLVAVLPRDASVLWQTGGTDVRGLGIDARSWVDPDELASALGEADLVVSHCGVGAALDALEAGRCPLLVPRRASAGEQVDDHQEQLAGVLSSRGLAVVRGADAIDAASLRAAAARRVRRDPVVAQLPLGPALDAAGRG